MYQPKSETEALEIYRKMVLVRKCQESIIAEYPKDEIKTPVHLCVGMEAISVGTTHPLPLKTKVFGPMRTHGLYLSIANETDTYFAELYGKSTGMGGGKAGSMHLTAPNEGLMATSGIVASTVSLAVGAAFANKYRGSDDIVMVTFGDSVLEAGEFWESLNFACLHSLKILFVCEDNGLAAQTPKCERHGFDSIPLAIGDGFDCYIDESYDGSDVLNVIDSVQDMVDRMDLSPRPGFLHFTYTRLVEHVGPNTDWDKSYRYNEPTKIVDPIVKYKEWLYKEGYEKFGLHLWSRMFAIEHDISEQIDLSIAEAKSDPYPTISDLYLGVFYEA